MIAYEHYRWRPGEPAAEQIRAQWDLSHSHWIAKDRQDPRPEIIKLNPQQVKLLDALAEAADIPHERGQAEIEIPKPLRRYEEQFEEEFPTELGNKGVEHRKE